LDGSLLIDKLLKNNTKSSSKSGSNLLSERERPWKYNEHVPVCLVLPLPKLFLGRQKRLVSALKTQHFRSTDSMETQGNMLEQMHELKEDVVCVHIAMQLQSSKMSLPYLVFQSQEVTVLHAKTTCVPSTLKNTTTKDNVIAILM
jgi:hypothetical protein